MFSSLNNLKCWIGQNDITAPFFERLRTSKPVTTSDLISLVTLSKAIASWYTMKISEACDWILNTITELSIYGLWPSSLPEKLEQTGKLRDIILELINSRWWDNPENMHIRFTGYDITLNEIAVLKSEAFLLFDLPFPEINDLLQKIEHDENQSDIGNADVYVSNIKLVLNCIN